MEPLPAETPDAPAEFLELKERRRVREPLIRVWDIYVRASHWLMVLFFAIIYLRYRKFPIHAYAGYLILIATFLRLLWGFVGPRAARFTTFLYSPREVVRYALDALRGHAAYYTSHNPMGAWMVFVLLGMMLANGTLGVMLYSAGQQLGPLGASVPENWDETLTLLHKVLGHLTAACVAMHITGVLWAARAHRENYIAAMFTGFKRVPRKADKSEIEGYTLYPEAIIPRPFVKVERWFNYRHPALGSLLIVLAVILVILELTEAAVALNKHLPAY
jgi:cytochrome b